MNIEVKDVITFLGTIGIGTWVSAVVTGKMAKHREDVSAQRNYLIAKIAKLETFYPEALTALITFTKTPQLDRDAQEKISLTYNKIIILGSDDVQEKFHAAIAAVQVKTDTIDDRVRQREAISNAMKEHLRILEESLAALNAKK